MTQTDTQSNNQLDTHQQIQGALTALITPFNNGKVDEAKLIDLINWQIEQGIHGLVPVGTTGESPTLSKEEHFKVIELTVATANGRVPVIAGTGSNNPVEAIAYTQFAQKVGADAVLSVAGYYNRPNQAGLLAHFTAIHDATDIPIIIYNIPPRTIVDVMPNTMQQLAELPRVIGVKDATADLSRISQEKQLITSPFRFLSGEDMTAIAYNAMGGHGCISVVANILPKLFSQLQTACLTQNFAEALAIHNRIMPVIQAISLEPNPMGVKYAAEVLGLCRSDTRLPHTQLEDKTKRAIEHAIEKVNS